MIQIASKFYFNYSFFKTVFIVISLFFANTFCFAADAALKNGKLIEETKKMKIMVITSAKDDFDVGKKIN